MKREIVKAVTGLRAGCLIVFLLGIRPLPIVALDALSVPTTHQPAQDEFSAVSKALVELLRSRNAAHFAKAMTPSTEDWKSILSTNRPMKGVNPLKEFEEWSTSLRQKRESEAKTLLKRADALHLDFSKGELHPRVVMPKTLGKINYNNVQGEGLPCVQKIELILNPDTATNNPANCEFKIALLGMVKFPGGWRCQDGVQWDAFPANLVDEKTRREVAILAKVAAHESITGKDDPALLKLGEALVRFVRDRDITNYEKDALVNIDLAWVRAQKMSGKAPSRREIEEYVRDEKKSELKHAQGVTGQMEDAGVDLKHADIQIKGASVQGAQSSGAAGSLDCLLAWKYVLELSVKTDAKAKNGASLSGDYVLSASRLDRYGDVWKVGDNAFHWSRFPASILDQKAKAAMDFENYIADNATLPPHTPAPEIEFITLADQRKMKLSDLRGKVVVLDFWATDCGPCQAPLAKLQTLLKEHPYWQDKVAIVPLSIDDSIADARKHLNKRGWTNTFNVWGGRGDWHCQAATAFRVTGIPTTYIIDAQGQIIQNAYPLDMGFSAEVNALLKPSAKPTDQ